MKLFLRAKYAKVRSAGSRSDPISFCQDNYGEQRVRQGCFVGVNEGEVTRRRALIVRVSLQGRPQIF